MENKSRDHLYIGLVEKMGHFYSQTECTVKGQFSFHMPRYVMGFYRCLIPILIKINYAVPTVGGEEIRNCIVT